MASGGPGSAKNDPKSAKVTRKFATSDICKATFIALVENFGKKIIKNSHFVRVYSPGTYLDVHGASRAIDSLWSH